VVRTFDAPEFFFEGVAALIGAFRADHLHAQSAHASELVRVGSCSDDHHSVTMPASKSTSLANIPVR